MQLAFETFNSDLEGGQVLEVRLAVGAARYGRRDARVLQLDLKLERSLRRLPATSTKRTLRDTDRCTDRLVMLILDRSRLREEAKHSYQYDVLPESNGRRRAGAVFGITSKLSVTIVSLKHLPNRSLMYFKCFYW